MKKSNILFLVSGFLLLTFTACNNAPEGEKAEVKEAVAQKEAVATDRTVQITPTNTVIVWTATKTFGGHHGKISVKDGSLGLKDGKLVSGKVNIDMNSIADEDLQEPSRQAKLVRHLKSEDFFDVANHPVATFEITKVTPDAAKAGMVSVAGNLTIKGITKSIEIPAEVAISKEGVNVKTPAFTINRLEWGIKFHSGILGTPKDMIINDNIGLQIIINAK